MAVRTDDMPPLMTVADTSRVLGGLPKRTVQKLCADGELPAVKLGRQWRVNRDRLYAQYDIREVRA